MNGTIYKNKVNYGVNISDSQPVGQIIESVSETTPAGYLPCDGRSLLRSDYPDLFKKIGTTYGAEDDEHFNLPNEIDIVGSYSTEEHDTGKVWLNGAKVYERTFSYRFTRNITAGTSELIQSNFPIPFNKIVFMKGSFVPINVVPLCGTADFYVYEGNLRMIQRYSNSNNVTYDVYVSVEYLK